MTGSTVPLPPAWVQKRDGRLVPFEPDKISQSLFAAGESLGRPDAFLARELTDGIVHFLCREMEGSLPTTLQIAELVPKVVRELGQPALARSYAEFGQQRPRQGKRPSSAPPGPKPEVHLHFGLDQSPAAVVRSCLRSYTLQSVFTRDLVAAQADGLLSFAGLESPTELAALVVETPSSAPGTLLEKILRAGRLTGRTLVLDGLEYTLARTGNDEATVAARFVREVSAALDGTEQQVVINLNCAIPPSWADDRVGGPLFARQPSDLAPERLRSLAEALLEALQDNLPTRSRVRIDWHLGEEDLGPESPCKKGDRPLEAKGGSPLSRKEARPLEHIRRLIRLVDGKIPLAFVLDRPRKPLALAEGIDRGHPALLLGVGLHLPYLAEQLRANGAAALFVQKLGSLARLALSAAAQKREFLRRQGRPELARGFLLERAQLMVVPLGLEAALRRMTGQGLCDPQGQELACRVVQRLREVLREDGQARLLEACLDGPAEFVLDSKDPSLPGNLPPLAQVAGLTAWDAEAPVRSQLRAAGVLHVGENGTAAVLLRDDRQPGPDALIQDLCWAWQHTEVVRLRFVLSRPNSCQPGIGDWGLGAGD